MDLLNIPITWDKLKHQTLDYSIEWWKDYESEQYQTWITAGHSPEVLTFNLHRFKDGLPDWCLYLSNYFTHLKHVNYCMHQVPPGKYTPSHVDHYNYYFKNFNIQHSDQIVRHIIFLEDWQDGHFLTVEDKIYSNWKSGDIAHWSGQARHAPINIGLTNRYTLQVTGVA